MKKLLLLIMILGFMPLLSFAHGAEDSANSMMPMVAGEEQREEMEALMKKMMVNGTLSEEEADRMIAIMNEPMPRGGMMGMMGMPMTRGMMSGFSGGMLGFGFMPFLFLLTTIVWLLVGIVALVWLVKKVRERDG